MEILTSHYLNFTTVVVYQGNSSIRMILDVPLYQYVNLVSVEMIYDSQGSHRDW